MRKTYHGKLPLRRGALRGLDRPRRRNQQVRLLDLHQDANLQAIVPGADSWLTAGEDALTDYQFGGATGAGIHHIFCSCCGVKPFGRGRLEGFGDSSLSTSPASTTPTIARTPPVTDRSAEAVRKLNLAQPLENFILNLATA